MGFSIKHTKAENGRDQYQAQVWHNGEFYGASTFDAPGLAQTWGKTKLAEAIAGIWPTAAERAAQRKCEAGLDQSISNWAQQYLDGPGLKHGPSRRYDYALVGNLLGKMKLRAVRADRTLTTRAD